MLEANKPALRVAVKSSDLLSFKAVRFGSPLYLLPCSYSVLKLIYAEQISLVCLEMSSHNQVTAGKTAA